jgi:hypothetical protein
MVERTPEGERQEGGASDGAPEAAEVRLTFIEPKPAPQPVGVGAEGGSSEDEPADEPPPPEDPSPPGEDSGS